MRFKITRRLYQQRVTCMNIFSKNKYVRLPSRGEVREHDPWLQSEFEIMRTPRSLPSPILLYQKIIINNKKNISGIWWFFTLIAYTSNLHNLAAYHKNGYSKASIIFMYLCKLYIFNSSEKELGGYWLNQICVH